MIGAVSAMSDEAVAIWGVGLLWACSAGYERDPGTPLDLVVFAEPCTWRARMLDAVRTSGQPWRIAFTSPSVAAVQAAVENGLGIALLAPDCIRQPVMRLLEDNALPDALVVQYGLFVQAHQTPVIAAVTSALLESVRHPGSAIAR